MLVNTRYPELIDTFSYHEKIYDWSIEIVEDLNLLERNIQHDRTILQRLYLDTQGISKPKLIYVTIFYDGNIITDLDVYDAYINHVIYTTMYVYSGDTDFSRHDYTYDTCYKINDILRIAPNNDTIFKIQALTDDYNVFYGIKVSEGKYRYEKSNELWEPLNEMEMNDSTNKITTTIKYGKYPEISNDLMFLRFTFNYVKTDIDTVLLQYIADNLRTFGVVDFYDVKEIRYYKNNNSYQILFKDGHEIRAMMIKNVYYVDEYYPTIKIPWQEKCEKSNRYGVATSNQTELETIINILKKYKINDMNKVVKILCNNGEYSIKLNNGLKIIAEKSYYDVGYIKNYDYRDYNSTTNRIFSEIIDNKYLPKRRIIYFIGFLDEISHKIQSQTNVTYVMSEINNVLWDCNIHSTDCISYIDYIGDHMNPLVPMDSWIIKLSNNDGGNIEALAQIDRSMPDMLKRTICYNLGNDNHEFLSLNDITEETNIHQIIPIIIKLLENEGIKNMRMIKRINFWKHGRFNIELTDGRYICTSRFYGLRIHVEDEEDLW